MSGKPRYLSITIVASLAGLLFGFDTAVISGVTQSLREVFHLSPATLGTAVSSALWGTLCGALFMGKLGDRFGTRDMLKLVGVFYLVSAVGCSLAWNLESFIAFRFIGGIAIGGSSVLAPVYISEIAPARRRGALVGLFQFNIVLGILTAYLSNFALSALLPGTDVWRWKLLSGAVPAAAFLSLLFVIPQSPRWLVVKDRLTEAAAVLNRLGTEDTAAQLSAYQRGSTSKAGSVLNWRVYRRPILLAISLALFNQLSGINAILYYLNDIFRDAGFSSMTADLQSVAVGAANLLATVAALSVIDRLGRRSLLLIGAVGMALALSGVTLIMATGQGRAWLLWLLIGFITSFAFSQGAVIWVYLSEIFPSAVRSRGQSLGSATHWFANAVISALFPVVAAATTSLPFAVFALCMVLQFGVVWAFFPETKRATLEHLSQSLESVGEPP
ncbi:MAG TPA: sugar porter family MFS transporter [Steroidobacteraceae bacterium]